MAVGLVALNHFWPSWFSCCYVGVDVLFVISGLLIASHLRRDLDATGRIRLAAFSSRHADPCTASAAQFPAHEPLARAADQIADPRLTFVDYHDVFCDSTLCHRTVSCERRLD